MSERERETHLSAGNFSLASCNSEPQMLMIIGGNRSTVLTSADKTESHISTTA